MKLFKCGENPELGGTPSTPTQSAIQDICSIDGVWQSKGAHFCPPLQIMLLI